MRAQHFLKRKEKYKNKYHRGIYLCLLPFGNGLKAELPLLVASPIKGAQLFLLVFYLEGDL